MEFELNMTSSSFCCEQNVEEEKQQEVEKVIDCQTEIESLSDSEEVVPKRFPRVIFPKNSFDPFGDLTEVILHYMTLEDKI